MGQVLLLAFSSALNPTLIAASTLMMLLPNPKRLMLGYLLGALMTSITLGLVVVFTIENSRPVILTRNTLSPAATAALGGVALLVAFVIGTGRHRAVAERRRARRAGKGSPRWQNGLGHGSARTTFVVGAVLTLPRASYLAGLNRIDKLDYATAATVVVVVGFNVIMLALLEIPLAGRRRAAVDRRDDRSGQDVGRPGGAAVPHDPADRGRRAADRQSGHRVSRLTQPGGALSYGELWCG